MPRRERLPHPDQRGAPQTDTTPPVRTHLIRSAAVPWLGWQANPTSGGVLWTYAFPLYFIEYTMRICAVLCCIVSNTYTV